jgi:hypothetical protein
VIFWVFGGTAVGKKRFIQQCLDPETRPDFLKFEVPVRAEWIEDGPVQSDIVRLSEAAHIFVRWQWGREEHLTNILQDHPTVQHSIVMLTCGLMTQLSRVALREGCLKWDAEILHGELRQIYECIHAISSRYRVPVFYVDSASADGYELRSRVP